MCDIQEVQVYQQYASRLARVSDLVEVYQQVELLGGTWQPAIIHWAAPNGKTVEQAREFEKCIGLACDIAEKWNEERAGKPFETTFEKGKP